MRWLWKGGDEQIEERKVLIRALSEEVDRQRASLSGRVGALMSRAAILVGSAGIFTALQSSDAWSLWFATSVASSGLAAILGVLVLFPRSGPELDIERAEKEFWNRSDTEAIRDLSASKLAFLRVDENALKRKGRLLRVGFVALGLSICLGAMHVLLSAHY